MLKKTVYFFSIFFALLINFSVIAATPKTYPPYPDVWGYDLSTLPAMKYGSAGIISYVMEDGDIWFLIASSYKIIESMDELEKKSDIKYTLIKFFKNERLELSEAKLKNLFKIIDKQQARSGCLYDSKLFFSDKSTLQFCFNKTGAKCFFPDFYNQYFLKTDPQGSTKKYSIFGSYSQVKMHRTDSFSDVPTGLFYYQKLYIFREIIPLKDDTFIVFENGGNLILRFNKDFETKFTPVTPVRVKGNYIMRNFFVIDYSVIEDLESKSPGESVPFYQYIHDGLLSYFHKKYSK